MQRRMEPDFARSAAMLGVVLIHASGGFVSRYSRISLGGGHPCSLL